MAPHLCSSLVWCADVARVCVCADAAPPDATEELQEQLLALRREKRALQDSLDDAKARTPHSSTRTRARLTDMLWQDATAKAEREKADLAKQLAVAKEEHDDFDAEVARLKVSLAVPRSWPALLLNPSDAAGGAGAPQVIQPARRLDSTRGCAGQREAEGRRV